MLTKVDTYVSGVKRGRLRRSTCGRSCVSKDTFNLMNSLLKCLTLLAYGEFSRAAFWPL